MKPRGCHDCTSTPFPSPQPRFHLYFCVWCIRRLNFYLSSNLLLPDRESVQRVVNQRSGIFGKLNQLGNCNKDAKINFWLPTKRSGQQTKQTLFLPPGLETNLKSSADSWRPGSSGNMSAVPYLWRPWLSGSSKRRELAFQVMLMASWGFKNTIKPNCNDE